VDQVAQHRIGRGRAADVPCADEQDSGGTGHDSRRYLVECPLQMPRE
jgi:hypothetical protein